MECKACGYAVRAIESRRCPECSRPFDPDDPTTLRQGGGPVRRALAIGATALGTFVACFVTLHFRSLEFGPSVKGVLFQVIAVLGPGFPFITALLFIHFIANDAPLQRTGRNWALNVVLIVAISIGAAEAYCGAQDLIFYMRHHGASGAATEQRWWPNGNHTIHHRGHVDGDSWGANC